MVRQEVDSERLRTLRAELEQQTALLPAVLQTSNCVALVDHLTSIFKDNDWHSAARCSQSLHTPEDMPAEQSGWSNFADFLREDPESAEAEAELQAMDIALTEMQANIRSIQTSTCLPPSRLASISGRDSTGKLETTRCIVCHSLLLTATFTDHLPSCRPCDPQSTLPARPSTASQPVLAGRAASRATAAKGKASKRGGSKGSKKPPAGPSRFAIQQAKAPPQPVAATRQSSDDSDLQLPPHPLPNHCQSPAADTQASVPSSSFPSQQMRSPHSMHRQQPGSSNEQYVATGDRPGALTQPQGVKRGRSTWTYEENLSRSNPEVDAVHDPCLPPRFPQAVTRPRTFRARFSSAAAQRQKPGMLASPSAGHADRAQAASGTAELDGLSRTVPPGGATSHHSQRQIQGVGDVSHTAQQPRPARLGQMSDLQSAPGRQHLDPPQIHGQHRKAVNSLASPAGLHGHVPLSGQTSSAHRGHSQGLQSHDTGQLQSQPATVPTHGSTAARPNQLQPPVAQGLPRQHCAWRLPPGSASLQGGINSSDGHSNPYTATKPKHPASRSINLPAANDVHPPANGVAGMHQQQQQQQLAHTRHHQPSNDGAAWPSVKGRVRADEGTMAVKVAGPGSWRMPESRRQVSVNALARMPSHT